MPSDLLGWITLTGFVVFGGVTIYGLVFKANREMEKDNDDLEHALVRNYKERVDQLEKKTEEQFKLIESLTRRISDLERANKIYTDLFQGVDGESKTFRERGFEAMAKIDSLTNGNERVLKNIDRLYILIEKHLANEEKLINKLS